MSKFGTIKKPLKPRGPKNTLSVCMIVKNEEANIARAIQSFLSFADEIIVNDTGSTDQTLEIVRSLPKTKLIQSEWKSDFSYSRNLSLDAATCAWCLWMDADDYVPPDQAEHFNKLKTAPLDRAFAFQICNTLNGLPVGVRFIQQRMFPNHPGLRFQGKIHEQIMYSLKRMGLHLYNLETSIWHLGYETIEIRQQKARRNLEIQLNDPDHDKNPSGLVQLGDSYSILGDYLKALEFYIRAFEFPDCARVHEDVYRTVPDNIGRQYIYLKQYTQAEEWFLKSESLFPGRPDPIYYRGDLYRTQGKQQEAQVLFEKVLDMPITLTTTGTRHDIIRMHCYKYICEYHAEQKSYESMHRFAERFHKEYPDTLESHYYLGLALLRLNQAQEAASILEQAYRKNPTFSNELLQTLGEAYAKSGNSEGMMQLKNELKQFESRFSSAAPLVSLCMIVKNEESNIGECLASTQGLVDQIIVVDTGSTDRTVEIAKAHGAQVEYFEWTKDFAAARNHSLSFATGQWILWLDADDRVPLDTVRKLRSLLQKANKDQFFALAVKNTTDQGKTGTRFDQIRLFPNHKGGQFRGKIHEQLFQSLESAGLHRTELPLEIYHTGYTDPETIRQKHVRNLEIFRSEFSSEAQMNALDMFHYAIAHENTQDSQGAIHWFQKSLDLARTRNEYEPLQTLIPAKIATILANQGRLHEALEKVNESQLKFPRNEECILLKAQILRNLGQTSESMRLFGFCTLFRPHNSPLPMDFKAMRLEGFKNLGHYWQEQGLSDLAIELLRTAKKIAEGEDPSLLSLAEYYFEYERYIEAVENLEFARPLCNDSEEYCLLLGKCLALAGKLEEARVWVKWALGKWTRSVDLLELWEIIGN